jgi:ferritin
MISPTMQAALNAQIAKEFASSYLYLSMAAYFEASNLPGFGNWLRVQAEEERQHAMKFYNHLLDRGGKVQLAALPAPAVEWQSAMQAVEEVLKHEEYITASIYSLYETALAEKDYPTQVMLHWFIEEQVEEEKNAADILDNMKRIEAHETAILMLDHRLAKREAE